MSFSAARGSWDPRARTPRVCTMQSNWAALQSTIKGKGGKKSKGDKGATTAVRSGAAHDAHDKKHAKKKKRQANDEAPNTTKRSKIVPDPHKGTHEGFSVASGDTQPSTVDPLSHGRILDSTSSLSPTRLVELANQSAVASFSQSPNALVEAARLESVSHLCFSFEQLVSPILGKARWANTFEELMLSHDFQPDPVLPSDDATRAFCTDRLSPSSGLITSSGHNPTSDRETITHAVELIVVAVKRARVAVQRARDKANAEKALPRIIVERITPQTESTSSKKPPPPKKTKLSLGKAVVEIRDEHLGKLRVLYAHHHKIDVSALETELKEFAEQQQNFYRAAFSCVARVVAAQGGMHRISGGHHSACHGSVFDVLKYGPLKVEAECFASPLNCRYKTFCSAFPDVDIEFGSLGSFFEFAPKHGSFQVNPPFEVGLVLRCAKRLNELLQQADEAGEALSFVVITPYWPNRDAYEALRKSEFNTNKNPLVIPANEHGYFEGAQHTKRAQYKPASCDTSVLFLQTVQGKGRYRVMDEVLESLRVAFRKVKESSR